MAKVTVTTTATSVYDLLLTGIDANHGKTTQEATTIVDALNRAKYKTIEIQRLSAASETIYYETIKGVDAVADKCPIIDANRDWYAIETDQSLKDITLIASGSEANVVISVSVRSQT